MNASDSLIGMMASKKAPANHTIQPKFEDDFRMAKALIQSKKNGSSNYGALFGHKIRADDSETPSIPINFGSYSSMGFNNGKTLGDDTRMRLFTLKKAYSNCEIQAMYKGQTKNPSKELIKSVPLWENFTSYAKAFNVTDFDSFINEVQARFYFEEYEIPLILADQFDAMPMTSPVVRVPGILGLLEGELEPDTGVFTAQENTSASYIVEAKGNVVHVQITQDLLDDSSPAMIDKLRKETVRGVARSFERAILDGDVSGAHIDADTQAGSAKLFSKAFNGLRKRAFDNEVATGASEAIVFNHNDSPSKDMFSGLLKRMKHQGSDKSDLLYILGSSVSHDLVSGAIPELFTAFAFGALASNVTGAVPPVFGIKGVESSYVREDLEATGKALSPAAGMKTYCMLVQKSRFNVWTRQATRVFASPSLPSSDAMLMTAKARHAFDGVPQSAEERSVVMAVNVSVQ